jgi:hypothetical protein
MIPPASPPWVGVELLAVLHSIQTAVSASRESRLRRSPLHGELAVVVHDLAHQLLNHLLTDDAILLARQFCDRLRDRINHFIRFRGIDFVGVCCCRVFGKEIVDEFDHHAVEAGAFLVFA